MKLVANIKSYFTNVIRPSAFTGYEDCNTSLGMAFGELPQQNGFAAPRRAFDYSNWCVSLKQSVEGRQNIFALDFQAEDFWRVLSCDN